MSGGGQSTCKEIAAIREKEKTNRQATDSLTGMAKPITQILGPCGVGSCNDSDNSSIGVIRQNFTNIQNTMLKNKCSNISQLVQENIDNQPKSCFDDLFNSCRNFITGETNIECLKIVRGILNDRKSVNQTNRNNSSAMCEINAAIEVIASQEASAKNAAILHSMQEAKGLLTNNKGEGFNCNEINQNVTSEQYLKVLLDCFQETAVKQSNKILGCHPVVVEQTNDNNDLKSCLLTAGILMKSTQSANSGNSTDIKNSQTAVGLDPAASLASLLPIVLICCILVVGAIFIIPMLGGMDGAGDSD
jgi:hypothetical protein